MANKIMELQNGSDIRGIAMEGVPGEEVNLTEDEAERIGAAFGLWLAFKVTKNPFDLKVCIGRDPRLSSETLERGLMKGLNYIGAKTDDAGLASTPAMFMATTMQVFDYDGAIMVTASHLPWNRNGFKFFSPYGGLDKEDITAILKRAGSAHMVHEFYEYESCNLMDMYAAHLRSIIATGVKGKLDGLHVVVDAGNGSGGFFAKNVLEPLGADISGSQFLDPDGHFPNHIPNPENNDAMQSVCRAAAAAHADLGLIFDTDVDRSAAVTGSGEPVQRNSIVALAAALRADQHPGGTVVTDSITSNELHDFLTKDLGLKHLRYKRGYRNVINKAVEISNAPDDQNSEYKDAFLAIETSGHAAYAENYYLDDGAYLACLIIIAAAKLKKEGRDISSLISGLAQPAEAKEFRLGILEDKIADDPASEAAGAEDFADYADIVLNSLENWAEETNGLEIEKPNYEGVRVNFTVPIASDAPENGGKTASGWFLLRKSLHDPVLPLNIEADTQGGVEAAAAVVRDFLDQFQAVDLSAFDRN